MNLLRRANFFTLVLILMTGLLVLVKAQAQTPAQIYASCVKKCAAANPPTPGSLGNATTPGIPSDRSKYDLCKDGCQADKDASAPDSECKDLYNQYQTENKETRKECAKFGQPGVSSCVAAANACGAALDSSGSDPVAALQGLVGAYATMQNTRNGGGAGGANGCFIDDDNSEESRQQSLDEKIARLKEENEDSVTKKAEIDDELAKKKEEVDDKIREADAEVNKKKIERQTKQQEEESRIQKAILKAQKTQFANTTQINKLNIDIVNLQFAQQQINIEFADSRINNGCDAKVMAMKAALTGATVPPGAPVGTKPIARKFTIKEAKKIEADLKLEQSTCLQTEVLKRSAQIKGLLDKRVGLQAQVDTLSKANQDEDKAVLIEKQAIEEMKKTMATEEQQDIDDKFKKQNILSASVAKYAELVEKKKKSIDGKVAARKEQIDKLILAKQNVKKKYSTISASLSSRQEAQRTFINQCCNKSTMAAKDKTNCDMVNSDYRSNKYTPSSGGGTTN